MSFFLFFLSFSNLGRMRTNLYLYANTDCPNNLILKCMLFSQPTAEQIRYARLLNSSEDQKRLQEQIRQVCVVLIT